MIPCGSASTIKHVQHDQPPATTVGSTELPARSPARSSSPVRLTVGAKASGTTGLATDGGSMVIPCGSASTMKHVQHDQQPAPALGSTDQPARSPARSSSPVRLTVDAKASRMPGLAASG